MAAMEVTREAFRRMIYYDFKRELPFKELHENLISQYLLSENQLWLLPPSLTGLVNSNAVGVTLKMTLDRGDRQQQSLKKMSSEWRLVMECHNITKRKIQ